MRSGRSRVLLVVPLLVLASSWVSAQTQTALPPSSVIPYSMARLVPATNVAGLLVRSYVRPNGSPDGAVIDQTWPVYDRAAAMPPPQSPEPVQNNIGAVRWQYALFKATSQGPGGALDRIGAALMGGFQLTQPNPDGAVHFAFLQIYRDANHPRGAIDGGGAYGKSNADIPGWNRDPGWNFDASRTQFDYFDVPFDSTDSDPETVRFETALVASAAHEVLVLDDMTWSFSANQTGAGSLTGMAPVESAGASASLLKLYRQSFPSVIYLNQGDGALRDLPDPGMAAPAAMLLWLAGGRRRVEAGRG